jgi:hypothetical protein
MSARRIFAAIALTALAAPALADGDVVSSQRSDAAPCPDRPPEPEWMGELGPREVYKRVLVQDIYRVQSMERIVARGSCACDIRFPSWDAAVATFRERFATAERSEMLAASDAFNREANALRPQAMAICDAEGGW